MEHASALSVWESFYVIVGSSGGALIGLQFVVITLIADRGRYTSGSSLSAFGTPTVVHLTGALGVSAIMSAPWPSQEPLAAALIAWGIAGLIYGVVVVRRARRQTEYQPVLEDWLYYVALPFVVYASLTAGALALRGAERQTVPLFVVAAAALALLLIGIHNAWDTVVHIVVSSTRDDEPGATEQG